MILPDCREDENYNQDFLDNDDKNVLEGFDWCVEMAVDNFFDNNYDSDDGSYLGHILAQELPETLKDEYEMEHSFGQGAETEKRKVITYADMLRMEILSWCENNRDELIVSLIEGMSDGEYEKIKARVLEENSKKPAGERKEYRNTRSFWR